MQTIIHIDVETRSLKIGEGLGYSWLALPFPTPLWKYTSINGHFTNDLHFKLEKENYLDIMTNTIIPLLFASGIFSVVCRPSVNFSHFHLPLYNQWVNINQSWHKAFWGEGISSLFKWRTMLFPRGDNSEMPKILLLQNHLATMAISTISGTKYLYIKRTQDFANKDPSILKKETLIFLISLIRYGFSGDWCGPRTSWRQSNTSYLIIHTTEGSKDNICFIKFIKPYSSNSLTFIHKLDHFLHYTKFQLHLVSPWVKFLNIFLPKQITV